MLKFCRDHGRVVVGLNSDLSVSRLKGPNRPINSQNDRKAILESIRYVDEVIIFDEATPYELIKNVKPDFIVKGGDYEPSDVIGADLAAVLIYPTVVGLSTTSLAEKIVGLNG